MITAVAYILELSDNMLTDNDNDNDNDNDTDGEEHKMELTFRNGGSL